MKSKILSLISLSILSLVLMLGMASAAINLSPSSVQINATHGSSSTFTFAIQNTYTVANATINQTLTSFTSSISNLVSGSNIIQSSNLSLGTLPTQVAVSSTSSSISSTLTIPSYTPAGIYVGNFSIDGSLVNDSTNPQAQTFSISLNVSSSSTISVSSATIAEGSNSTTITVRNTGNVALTTINLSSSGDFGVNFSTNNFDLAAGASQSVTVTATEDLNDLLGTDPSVTIRANASDGTTSTGTVSTTPSFCGDVENRGNLEVIITELNVAQGFGDDENFWYPFDVIEAEIEVTNDGNWDIENIEVSWELYTTAGKKITDDTETDFDLDEGDDKTLILTFALDENVDDMEGENLILYVKAQGKINDKDSTYDNDETCEWTSTSEDYSDLELITDDNFAVLNKIEINGALVENLRLENTVACGSELQITADVWNIEDEDMDDVTVLIKNNDLGISKKVVIGDINSFDSEKLETTITIPANVEAGEYTLSFMIYDEDNDLFETDEGDDAIFNVRVNVDGNCKVKESSLITAALTSEAQSGELLTVKATIKNIDSKVLTYTLNINGYESWATLEDFEKSLTLVAGESRDVTLTFNVNKGVSGNKMFNLETISGNNAVTTQPVSVSIAPQKSLISGLTIDSFGENKYLWGIGALNALLILAIIIVAIRLSRD